MSRLVFCLEEASAQFLLEGVLSQLLPHGWTAQYIPFKGKQDLEKNRMKKLRGWLEPDTRFVVLRDQDSGDCVSIKSRLAALCAQAGRPETLIRIACRELESFYFGDLEAVEKGLQVGSIAKYKTRAKYRNPDVLGNPSEELIKLTQGKYQKGSGSRAIAPHLNLHKNSSHSFNVLIEGIRRVVRA